jgi:WD40 repeat protein/serine/threonine protein kinase
LTLSRAGASAPGDSQDEALFAWEDAFERAAEPGSRDHSSASIGAIHECERLLEAVWPREAVAPGERPARFGRFSILGELGRGGFGVVFLAEDPVLGRRIALKVPRPEVLLTPELRRRFLREAEAASRLDHRHIVPVYEVGEDGPISYIASAYCDGPTLADWLGRQRAPAPVSVAARIVAVLAGAVAHAHERGILHRDLKPCNILLQREPACPGGSDTLYRELGFCPRICDFGLAKLLDQVSQETHSGVPIGSCCYMAPEQAGGRLREHGPAMDVYALGAILYELLAGRPPLRGETDLETLRLVIEDDPPSPRALRPGLARDLETICLKCLRKRPEERYGSAAELALDLERYLGGRTIRARPLGPWHRLGKWARRRPVHAALVRALLTILLTGMGSLEWGRRREQQYHDGLRAALDRSRQSEQEAVAQRVLAEKERLVARRHWASSQIQLAGSLIERGRLELAGSILAGLGPGAAGPDARGYSGRYLARLAVHLETVAELKVDVDTMAQSPDGRTIAMSDGANNIVRLDCETGRLRPVAGAHRLRGPKRLLFAPDGGILGTIAHDRGDFYKTEVKLWNVASGREVEGMPGDFGFCYELAFSPDGGHLVTVESPVYRPAAPVRSWKLSDARTRVVFDESLSYAQLSGALTAARGRGGARSERFQLPDVLALAPLGDLRRWSIAVFREEGEFLLYKLRSGFQSALCRDTGAEVIVVPRTDDLTPYARVELDAIADRARAVSGQAPLRMIGQELAVRGAAFSRDGRVAAVLDGRPGGAGITLRFIDVTTGRLIPSPPWDAGEDRAIAFAPSGNALFMAGRDKRVRRWHLDDWVGPAVLPGHQKEVWSLAFSPDGASLASAADDHTIKLWDLSSGKERATLRGHGALVTCVAYSPDRALLASASFDKTIRLWEAATGAAVATLRGHAGRVRALAFSPDGAFLASAGDEPEIRRWHVASRTERLPRLSGGAKILPVLAFAPDGATLYSGGEDRTIQAWDWPSGRLRYAWAADEKVSALAVARDGQTLAVGQNFGRAAVWDIASGTPKVPLVTHASDVLAMAFDRDGQTLASASRDRTVRLWDPVLGQGLVVLQGHTGPVQAATFSPDGSILATGAHDGTIRLWRASRR